MSFRLAITLNGLLFAGLFLVLCFVPTVYLTGYGITTEDSAQFITRRASPMFLGLTYMMWAIRDLAPSPARSAVTDGTAILLLGIAATGLYSLATGAVGPKILVGVAVEIPFAIALFSVRNKAP
ncbi:hypothetical protein [Cognatishimia sp. MH4019]|uniref:hypothetical protein n=1 Tax=Cognatishimia sp. MH4019 TaxID=2854030 RepID=UPI001CD63309|nr:hypothetical protein [Cognatishimia sp. MH4019]